MERITNLWKTTAGKIAIIGGSIVLLCCLCSIVTAIFSPSTPSAPPDVSAIQTQAFETALANASPSETPSPTHTAAPTNTPLPSATSTPEPEPIILTGTGDSIVDIAKGDYPAIMLAKHTGGSNFIVTNYDSSNNEISLLINTIGAYEGTRPLDFLVGEQTARFEIKAGGTWEIQILPLSQVRHVSIPGTVQGTGDDVFYLDGSNPDTIAANASQASGNFILYSYSDNGYDLVFNEIAPYTGTALLNNTTFLISLEATGPWSLDITTR